LPSQLTKQNKLIGNWIKTEAELAVAATYEEKKIGSYTHEDMQDLVNVMAQWRLLLGVTTDSTDHELIVICQFVYDNFKRFTLSDIKLAMNWTISSRIDVGFVSQKTISSFYVSKALNAYEDEKRAIYNQIMYRRDKHLMQLEKENKPVVTPAEKANTFKSHISAMYSGFKKDGFFMDIGDFVYDWLKKTKQLDTRAEMINKAVEYGRTRYLEEKRKETVKQTIAAALEPKNDKEAMQKKYARHYMVMQYFDSHELSYIVGQIKHEQFVEK